MTETRRDRRAERHTATKREILDAAWRLARERGLSGWSLRDVATEVGMRAPSLYVYFDSKNALYDALFQRGWAELLAALLRATGDEDPLKDLHAAAETFVRWSVEHPAYAPLMFWRPVPGFTPSGPAYAPAVETTQRGHELLRRLQAAGVLAADADLDQAWRTWSVYVTGVITQQLANAPGEPYEDGFFTSTVPDLIAMWLAHYGAVQHRPDPPR